MSYFHLALQPADNPEWDTFKFLEQRALAPDKPNTAEDFAAYLRDELNKHAIQYCKQANMGIGIHFTAYEEIEGYHIPEMFYLSNISGIDPQTGSYLGWNKQFSMGRHSFFTINEEQVPVAESHRDSEFRLAVKAHLDFGQPIWFNNGDPALFNQTANALSNMSRILSARQLLNDASEPVKFYSNLALQPVEIVSAIQSKFCKENSAVVGGKRHQLTITPTGNYSSETGMRYIGGFSSGAVQET